MCRRVDVACNSCGHSPCRPITSQNFVSNRDFFSRYRRRHGSSSSTERHSSQSVVISYSLSFVVHVSPTLRVRLKRERARWHARPLFTIFIDLICTQAKRGGMKERVGKEMPGVNVLCYTFVAPSERSKKKKRIIWNRCFGFVMKQIALSFAISRAMWRRTSEVMWRFVAMWTAIPNRRSLGRTKIHDVYSARDQPTRSGWATTWPADIAALPVCPASPRSRLTPTSSSKAHRRWRAKEFNSVSKVIRYASSA